MRLSLSTTLFQVAAGLAFSAALAFGATPTSGTTTGKADLKSAGQLAFGPNGVLFVGDAVGAAVYAIETADTKPAAAAANLEIKAINEKIAAMLGTMPDQILINDIKVNPISKKIYLSVSRGRGPDGIPVILRIDNTGKLEEFSLDNVKYSMVTLPDAPESKPDAAPKKTPEGMGAGNPRASTITDMSYMDGKVIIAGVSNEEFSSDLRSVPYPFHSAERGTSSVEIWHSQHGRYETRSPIRTFIPYTIDKQPYILATYACTPLVKMPVSALKPGAKVEGETIAELGVHNTPLEMIPYRKEGHDYILVANSIRGVMKVNVDNLGSYKPIVPKNDACKASREPAVSVPQGMKSCGVDFGGTPFETLKDLKGVYQMSKADDKHAVLLQDSAGGDTVAFNAGNATVQTPEIKGTLDLKTIALP
jgi:hypothetical protein